MNTLTPRGQAVLAGVIISTLLSMSVGTRFTSTAFAYEGSNNPPVLGEIGNKTVDEEALLAFTATATDPDTESEHLRFSLIGAPVGAVVDSETGEFTWTPTEAQGPDEYTFTVQVSDQYEGENNEEGIDSEEITVTVREVNQLPTAASSTVATPKNTPITIPLSATDHDIPAQTLSFLIWSNPSHGVVVLDSNQATYTPDNDFLGDDSFFFRVNDSDGYEPEGYDGDEESYSNVARVDIAVFEPPLPPTTTIGGGPDGIVVNTAPPVPPPADVPPEVVVAPSSTPAPEPVVGEVLGARTTCGAYLNGYLKFGAKNNPDEVKKLQEFLNSHNFPVPVTGFFGIQTHDAVMAFQRMYSEEILRPWLPFGLESEKSATGYVYKTTLRWINQMSCADLALPLPQLP